MPLAQFQYEAGVTTPDQVRQALLEAGDYLGGLMAIEPDKHGAGHEGDVRSAIQRIHNLDPLLSAIERSVTPPVISDGPQGATALLQNRGALSAGALVIGNDDYKSFSSRGAANSTFQDVEIDGSLFVNNGEQWRATIDSTTGAAGGAGVWLPLGQPYQTPPIYRQMRLFLRDVLSVQGTGLASVPYIREVNPAAAEFSASAVAEGSAKPEVAMNWVQDDAPVRKIAAWVPATEEAIDDAPTLRGYIDTRLSYMLAVREEFEILNGSGSAPHLKGILNFTDLQTQTGSDKFATLGLAQAKIELVDGDPDGIAMNPLDYWTAITTRQATKFDGEGFTQGGSVPPFGNVGNMPIWGLPVVRSRALPSGTAIVAAWRMGATLFDRLQTTIRVGNQHSDFFTNNKVAILAEERVALAVHRPDFFVKVTFS